MIAGRTPSSQLTQTGWHNDARNLFEFSRLAGELGTQHQAAVSRRFDGKEGPSPLS